MISITQLLPGVTLHCKTDRRFKQNTLSIQFCRTISDEEAGLNALLPAVLLRGCKAFPDMRQIILQLDDLYGAGVTSIVRRTGDYQSTGIACSFIDDRFAMAGDRILAPMIDFIRQLIREPYTENGVFSVDYVESERKNLLAAIDSQKNDKRIYAGNQLRKLLCAEDAFGIPRLGRREQVAAITPEALWAQYCKVLQESPVELFYVGSQDCETVAALLQPLFADLDRHVIALPPQTTLNASLPQDVEEELDVAQGRLAVGYTSFVHTRHELYVPMQVLMMIFAGSSGKLFNVIREKLSLCYDIGGTFYSSKGFMIVQAGIDFDKKELVLEEVERQLQACCNGNFTDEEFRSAKAGLISQLQASQDSPGAIESYYMTGLHTGLQLEPQEHIRRVEHVTVEQVQQAAASFKRNTIYFLKGVQ